MIFKRWSKDRSSLLKYLRIADPDERAVQEYLNMGDVFVLVANDDINDIIAVALMIYEARGRVELKNLVVRPKYQGQGYGGTLIDMLIDYYKKKNLDEIVVGTANSSFGNLEFYHQKGFTTFGVKEGFFDLYPEPIFENGIQAHDMIMLIRKIDDEN